MSSPSFALHTLGCRVNQYDSEALREAMREAGYREVSFEDPADVYIINTCAVTGEAARKSRQVARKAARTNPHALVVMAGCYPAAQESQARGVEGVHLLVGTRAMTQIPLLVAGLSPGPGVYRGHDPFPKGSAAPPGRGRALLKIQEGCGGACSYCLVPRARGTPVSRPPGETIREVQRLSGLGYREIVLTGVNLASWGRDLGEGEWSLSRLLPQLESLEGHFRIRLSSLEPMDLDETFLEAMASLSRVCHHLHLPLQSGSDRILGLMNRPYTVAGFRDLVERARHLMPDLGVTTDVMVGFPGESQQDHLESMEAVRRMGFSRLHVFPFSPRPGTPAQSMDCQIPGPVKRTRRESFLELDQVLRLAFYRRFRGREMEVVLEEPRGKGFSGYTRNYIPAVTWGDGLSPGDLAVMRVETVGQAGVRGPGRIAEPGG